MFAQFGSTVVPILDEFENIFNNIYTVDADEKCEYTDIDENVVKPTKIAILTHDVQKHHILSSIVNKNPPIFTLINVIIASGVSTLTTDVKKYIDGCITNIKCDVYAWYRLSQLTDYELHRHLKCNWPILPSHDPKWIARAVAIGVPIGRLMAIIGAEYPGAPANPANIVDTKICEPNDDITHIQEQIAKHNELKRERKMDLEMNRNPVQLTDVEREERWQKRNEWLIENTTYKHYEKISSLHHFKIMTYEQATNIFTMYINVGSIDYAILMAMNLMASTQTAHLAIKNPSLMRLVGSIMDKYPKLKPVVATYALSYAFRTTIMEERMVGQKITKDSRAWWSEDQFLALPQFNYMPHNDPYCSVLPGTVSIYAQLPYYVVGNRRFTTRAEYTDRINYGTRYQGTKPNIASVHSLIPYGKWSTPGVDNPSTLMFLSGGYHQACCSVRPIEQNYETWQEYIDCVYPGQNGKINDLFIEFYHYALEWFTSHNIPMIEDKWNCDMILKTITDNIHVDVEEIKVPDDVLHIINLHKMIDNHIYGNKELKIYGISDMDISIHSNKFELYEKIVFDIFNTLKLAGYERIWLRKVPRAWKFKYSIMGPDLTRPIDMYRVDCTNIQLMRKFHLDPVRILWDGTTRWALSSSVGFHLTGVVSTLIWLSNNKDPIDLVCNYTLRGCSKFTNTNMGKTLRTAIKTVAPFNKYPIVFGPVAHNHGIFVDKLIISGKKITVNNARLPWSQYVGHKWHDGSKVIVPDITSFHGQVSAALS